jgi:hypothetical protein
MDPASRGTVRDAHAAMLAAQDVLARGSFWCTTKDRGTASFLSALQRCPRHATPATGIPTFSSRLISVQGSRFNNLPIRVLFDHFITSERIEVAPSDLQTAPLPSGASQ